jgi:hypothetical protein
MQVVTAISDVIQIGIGLDECAKIALKKWKLVHSQNLILQQSNTGAQTGKNIQVPREWRKWGHTTSTNKKKLKKE